MLARLFSITYYKRRIYLLLIPLRHILNSRTKKTHGFIIYTIYDIVYNYISFCNGWINQHALYLFHLLSMSTLPPWNRKQTVFNVKNIFVVLI